MRQLVGVHQEVPVGMLVHVPNEQVRLACTRHHRHQPEYLAVLVLKVVQVGADVLVAHQGHVIMFIEGAVSLILHFIFINILEVLSV